jgi:hypothetical protein
MFSRSNIVHREVIELQASPEQVREFIMTPERIMDYYPAVIEGGVIEPGSSLYCRGKSGVSLLEVMQSQSTDQLMVVKVTSATGLKPPYTAERIRSATFFTMIEDWKLESSGGGTLLTKTWRDIHKRRLRFLPMGLIVRESARAETEILRAAWDAVVQVNHDDGPGAVNNDRFDCPSAVAKHSHES